MEGGPPKPAAPKIEDLIPDVEKFGNFLQINLKDLKMGIIAEKLQISGSTVYKWHQGFGFPKEADLPKIAKVYRVNLEELTEFWKLSKEARRKEVETRKTPKKIIRSDDWELVGKPGRKKTI